MAWTYKDYEWILDRYPWMDTNVCVAFVLDAATEAVLDAVTFSDEGSATGLDAVYNNGPELVGVAALDDHWTLAISPTTWSDEAVRSLSQGREVVHFQQYWFTMWTDGLKTAHCDLLLRDGTEGGSTPERWRPLMKQAGLPIDTDKALPDGKFHITEGAFAMASNHTGIPLTEEYLTSTIFAVGSTRY